MLEGSKLRLIISLFLIIPLCYLISRIKSPKRKIIITASLTIVFHLFIFRLQALFLWLQYCIVYCLCKWAPRKSIGTIVFIQSFLYLFLMIGRGMKLYYGQWIFDFTSPLCMQTIVFFAFASNYQKGLEEKNNLEHQHSNTQGHSLTIVQLPDLLHYIGFVLFLPASLVGPVYQYQDYYHWVHRTSHYQQLPNTIGGILNQSKYFLMFAVIYIVTRPVDDIEYLLTEDFAASSYFWQFFYIFPFTLSKQVEYCVAWSIGMLGVNATGITYNPTSKKKWDRITVSDFYTFYLVPSFKKKAQAWNQSVQVALRRYIYDKSMSSVPKNASQSIRRKKVVEAQVKTVIVSILWHGFYPGYYVSFFNWFFVMQIDQELFRISAHNEKFSKFKKRYLDILYGIFIQYYIAFFGTCFLLMEIDRIWIFMKACDFIPIIVMYTLYFLLVPFKGLKTISRYFFPQHHYGQKKEQEIKNEQITANQKKSE